MAAYTMTTESDRPSGAAQSIETDVSADPVIPEFDDMQALVRFGHGRLQDSCFMLLSVRDCAAAGSWLQLASFNSAATQDPLPETAMQIAFTPAGLQTLGLPKELENGFSDEYIVGMAGDESRSRRLGDINDNAPQHWKWGYHDQDSMHALLLLYARPGELDSLLANTRTTQFNSAFDLLHVLPTDTLSTREPFGFVDGISQPDIDWHQQQPTDVHSRDRYSNVLAPGEIVLGYPNEYGQLTRRPVMQPARKTRHDFGRNGSYLVLRQLEQDVSRFHAFCREHDNSEVADHQLAALIVGRQMDGEPLIPSNSLNDFTYDEDPRGLQCPISSHIRRSNPRTGDFPPGVTGLFNRLVRMLGFKRRTTYEDLIASTRFHRILRRGRTYSGSSVSDPQGLQFLCLGANILRQFEFIQAAWSTSTAFAGLNEQRDPLIAHREQLVNGVATDSFSYSSTQGPQHKVHDLPRFVTVRGGAYFFLPGLDAIRFLGRCAIEHNPVESDRTGTAAKVEADS